MGKITTKKLRSDVNLFWRQKDFRHQRKVFGKMCFSRKKAKIMGKSKACENSTLLFFVIAFFLRIFLARMYCSSAIACLDWTRTPFFFLVWTKLPFFFSRFPLILLSETKTKTNQQLALFVVRFWFRTKKHFCFFDKFPVPGYRGLREKKFPVACVFFWQKKENFNVIQILLILHFFLDLSRIEQTYLYLLFKQKNFLFYVDQKRNNLPWNHVRKKYSSDFVDTGPSGDRGKKFVWHDFKVNCSVFGQRKIQFFLFKE